MGFETEADAGPQYTNAEADKYADTETDEDTYADTKTEADTGA